MRRYRLRIRTHRNIWALDHIIVTLSRAFVHTVGLFDEAARTLRVFLRETGSTSNIWLVPYIRLAAVCLSSNGGMEI